MRILVAGAGAVGGYFGGRLAQKAEDVTFLLRPVRKRRIDEQGLTIKSFHGDYHGKVKTISRDEGTEAFDLIVLGSKAYNLAEMIEDVTPRVAPHTRILPLLNGYAHYELLKEKWGADKILGGLCFIESTLGPEGEILQTSPQHRIVFGSFTGNTDREQEIAEHLSGANFELILSDHIMQEIWTKYTYITCLSGVTTLTRSPLGPIRDNEWGWRVFAELVAEVVSIAAAAGFPVNEDTRRRLLELARGSHAGLKSSMQRDMEKGLAVEGDHLQGYLLDLARRQGKDPMIDFPILSTVYANLKVYEQQLLFPRQ